MNRDLKVHQVPGTPGPFLVDGFKHVRASPTTRAYFLSHFHSDHYGGLDERFDAAPIYCTQITASLVAAKLGVKSELLRPCPVGEAFVVQGVSVTFVDANHCPGAVLLLFELPCGRKIVHCGDMRYHPRMQTEPSLLRVKGEVDTVYLDTTYCEEKHTFPPQEDSIALVVNQVTKQLALDGGGGGGGGGSGGDDGICLVLLSAYTIGKEKVLLEVSRATGHQIYVSPEKLKVVQCLDLKSEELGRFTSDMSSTPIHVTKMGVVGDVWPYFQPNFGSIRKYIQTHSLPYKRALGVIPTGWAASSKWNRTHAIQTDESGCYSVMLSPYSEHSNFEELQAFVSFIRPAHIIPTVYSDDRAAKRMVARFAGSGLLNTTAAKRDFLALFSPAAASSSASSSISTSSPDSSKAADESDAGSDTIGTAPVSDSSASAASDDDDDDDATPASIASRDEVKVAKTEETTDIKEDWAEAEAAWAAAEKEIDDAAASASACGSANPGATSTSDRNQKRRRVESESSLAAAPATAPGSNAIAKGTGGRQWWIHSSPKQSEAPKQTPTAQPQRLQQDTASAVALDEGDHNVGSSGSRRRSSSDDSDGSRRRSSGGGGGGGGGDGGSGGNDDGVRALLDMGFGREVAERALRVSGGDIEAAVGSLLYRAEALG